MGILRFFRRRHWDDERRRELESYLAIEIDDNIARGMTPDEARRAAYRKLGNPTAIREEVYDMNTIGVIESTTQDLKFGLRVLRRNPAFALVAILSLGLGVGANTAIFQIINTVRLRTLPIVKPQELALVRVDNPPGGRSGSFTGRYPSLTYAQWQLIRDGQRSFSGVFAWGTANFDLSTTGESKNAAGIWVSGEFFETLGIAPIAGRLLTRADDRPGCGAGGVVISEPFWQATYGGRADAIGSTVHLNGQPFQILGVTPASFFGVEVGHRFDVAVPICSEPVTSGARNRVGRAEWWWLSVMGRLKPGVTIDQASQQLAAMSPGVFSATVPAVYQEAGAKNYRKFTLKAFAAPGGVSDVRNQYQTPLTLLISIAGLVLLIACGNLANLMLARASAREREMAVRLAIGASRRRLIRQLMAESLLVAFGGALLGGWLATSLSRGLVSLLGSSTSSLFFDLRTDWLMLAFTAGLALATCLLFGLVPAFRATKTTPASVLRAGGRGMTDGGARFSLRRTLVIAQLAISLVLLVGALLFLRTFQNLASVETGMDTANVLTVDFDFRRANIPVANLEAVQRAVLEKVQRLPGVTGAASAWVTPLTGSGWNETVIVDGKAQDSYPNVNRVSTEFFPVMGVKLQAGRLFNDRDVLGAPPAAVVTRAFVRKYMSDRDPIGRTFKFEQPPGEAPISYEVIGVVADAKYSALRDNTGPIVFLADAQETAPEPGASLLVKTTGASSINAGLVSVAREVSPAVLVAIASLDKQIQDSLVTERLMAILSGFFGALAGVLAAIGLYGVMSYMVAQRRQEIGIRMALGADRTRVLWMIGREAGMLVGVGVISGGMMAAYVAKYATTLLFGLQPRDPWTFGLAAGVLVFVAIAATLLPALRASRLEPTTALRD